MRKFLNFFITLFILAAFAFTIFENKQYLFGEHEPITYVKDQRIYYEGEPIYVNGINLDSVKPGYLPGNYAATKEDYEKWFQQIADLNMNCVKVKSIMPARFYQCLKEYNQNHRRPLYLIQGVTIDNSDIDRESIRKDHRQIHKLLFQRVKDTVDIVHGNKTPVFSKHIKELYRFDVSEYTLAYSIDSALDYDDIIYSEIVNHKGEEYESHFITTKKGASETEKFFARIANEMVRYENWRYRTQRVMTIQGSRSDIVEAILLQDHHTDAKGKKRYIDLANIQPTSQMKSGMVASYSLNLENNEQMNYKGGLKLQIKELQKYNPTMPILISEYAVPTTKVGDNYSKDNEGTINEKEQGENLIEILEQIKDANLCGQVMLEWQDSWYRSAWNIQNLVQKNHAKYWDNTMSYSQHYGLLSFDPSAIYPDGDLSDWKGAAFSSTKEGYQLAVQQDEAYLYLCLKSEKSLKDRQIRLALDTTPKSGSTNVFRDQFNRSVDFYLALKNKNGRLYVQKYYSPTEFMKNKEAIHQNPNRIHKPDKNEFTEVEVKVQNRFYSKVEKKFMEDKYAKVGYFHHGNAHPNEKDYDSNADYYLSDHTLEVRIPWQLLNFYDPTQGKVIDDFYHQWSIHPLQIEKIYVAGAIDGTMLPFIPYTLERWQKPTYTPRLKESYWMLKEYFSKQS